MTCNKTSLIFHNDLNTLILGIDPGKNGGLATIHPNEATVAMTLETESANLVDQLREMNDEARMENYTVQCAIEEPPRYTGRNLPGSTIAVLFSCYGILLGAALAFRWTVHTVRPQTWQKDLRLGNKKDHTPGKWKSHLKSEAIKKFPHVRVTNANADALLIALWCRKHA